MENDVLRASRAAKQAARRFPELSLVVLFGSRARCDSRESSDRDLAYCATEPIDALANLIAK